MQKIIDNITLDSQITPLHQCNYLPDRAARLEFIELKDEHSMATPLFSQFSRLGFRRSGQHLYRPLCFHCQRCIATRLPVHEFMHSRTHRKILGKALDIDITVSDCHSVNERHFALYARYICARHSDGDMYPPSLPSFQRFLQFSFTDSFFMEFWRRDQLIMVAVCDQLDDGISAVYTFFEPELERQSLGTLAILTQVDYVKKLGLPYLYLGYWVPEADKMDYKAKFYPIELLINQAWYRFDQPVTADMVEPILQQAIKQHYLTEWRG